MNNKGPAGVAVAVSFCILSGCATGPAPRWELPAKDQVPSQTLDYARAYADNARRAYQDAIDDEIKGTTHVGTGLIVLGGVLAGLAGFGAHRDTLLGGALLGGTAYGVATWTSGRARLPFYQAGLEAINCAQRAVAPLGIPGDDLKALKTALTTLDSSTPPVQSSLASTQRLLQLLAARGLNKQAVDGANASIEAAEQALVAAGTASKAGEKLVADVQRAGAELIYTVDRIDNEVRKQALSTFPDLAAVRSIVPAIGVFGGDLAPGAGIAERIAAGFAAAAPRPPQAGRVASISKEEEEQLQEEVNSLNERVQTLRFAAERVRAKVTPYEAASTQALKQCGIGEVLTAMRAVPELLRFSGVQGEQKIVAISGGTPQYATAIEPADGSFTVSGPSAGSGVIALTAAKALAPGAQFVLTVTDSTKKPEAQKLSIPISVSSAALPPVKANGVTGEADAAPTLDKVRGAISGLLNPVDVLPDVKVRVSSAALNTTKDAIDVRVTCEPASPASGPLKADVVRDALLKETGEVGKAFTADGKNKEKVLVTSPSPSCVAPDRPAR